MPDSENHAYNVPNEGDPNWDEPLNENFRDFDADIEIRDAASNRSSYTPKDGARFLATDTGVVSLGDGSSWLPSLAVWRFTAPATSGGAGNLVAGHPSNSVASGVSGATIAGGGFDDGSTARPNEATANFGTVAGGVGNRASAIVASVGGGQDCIASGQLTTVGGGRENTAARSAATVGGGWHNVADGQYATIAGGGPADESDPANTNNAVYDDYGTIGGGGNNQAGSDDGDSTTATFATVAGGNGNRASGETATVGGGVDNVARSDHATVAGGEQNEAFGIHGTVGGGFNNATSGPGATVPGGINNTAGGVNAIAAGGSANTAAGAVSFAAGRLANASDDGAFVWGDSTPSAVASSATDAFTVQADGGATIYSASDLSSGVELTAGSGSWSSLSARASKANVEPVDPADALEGVRDMEVSTWNYESQDESVRHMGPMAEEFHEEFGLGEDRERISTVDADGVALAAIQGLAAELEERDERIDEQRERIEELAAVNESLRERLSAVEARVGTTDGDGTAQASGDD